MSLDESHFDFERAFDRDVEREPTHGDRSRRKLSATGSVRISYVCPTDVHEAMKRDAKAWSEMGAADEPKYMPAYNDDDDAPMVLELRTCKCGSTLAMEVAPSTEAALNILRREGLL